MQNGNGTVTMTYASFREELMGDSGVSPEGGAARHAQDLSTLTGLLGISPQRLAAKAATATGLRLVQSIEVSDIDTNAMSFAFARRNGVLPIRISGKRRGLVVANPFDAEAIDVLRRSVYHALPVEIMVAAPEQIFSALDKLFDQTAVAGEAASATVSPPSQSTLLSPKRVDIGATSATAQLERSILKRALDARASDIHIQPKVDLALIRYRVDGEMQEARPIGLDEARRLISRFKALAGLDIAERRRPQDGALDVDIGGKPRKLRLATAYTPQGESLTIRILEPTAEPKSLAELGMTPMQSQTLCDLAERRQGLILVVGPTGSGKSTTIHSLLSQIDIEHRSLISVEDPVEYRIPFANQQQVDLKVGVTFDTLLKSAVRQDPDLLFLGELRDAASAKAAIDFAAAGHLTISTLHSSNAVTSIFRLERLGISRSAMAEALIGVVAQRLIRRLCSDCNVVRPTTQTEADNLRRFTDDVPNELAHPEGCPRCNGTGYRGREGIYEVLPFDYDTLQRVRNGEPIDEIRKFLGERGEYLISSHAVDKLHMGTASYEDVYANVLVEEPEFRPERQASVSVALEDAGGRASILIVEDDPDNRALLEIYLNNAGYDVEVSEDGAEALMKVATRAFDLILSDVQMPNLDGFKLLEILGQKGIRTPVMFLTASTESEAEERGLTLGAADYLRKPIQKSVLLLRVEKVLAGRPEYRDTANRTQVELVS